MELAVTIQTLNGRGFVATSGEPLAASVEAPTRGEAIRRLRAEIERRLASGIEVLTLRIGNGPPSVGDRAEPSCFWQGLEAEGRAVLPRAMSAKGDPLEAYASDLREDPLNEEWVEAMREYRREVDSSPDPWE